MEKTTNYQQDQKNNNKSYSALSTGGDWGRGARMRETLEARESQSENKEKSKGLLAQIQQSHQDWLNR